MDKMVVIRVHAILYYIPVPILGPFILRTIFVLCLKEKSNMIYWKTHLLKIEIYRVFSKSNDDSNVTLDFKQ